MVGLDRIKLLLAKQIEFELFNFQVFLVNSIAFTQSSFTSMSCLCKLVECQPKPKIYVENVF